MSIAAAINLVIVIIVLGVIVWLVNYVLSQVPIPEPFNRVAKVVLTVIACLILIAVLLQFAGIAFLR